MFGKLFAPLNQDHGITLREVVESERDEPAGTLNAVEIDVVNLCPLAPIRLMLSAAWPCYDLDS
jgi:hypothetical protein